MKNCRAGYHTVIVGKPLSAELRTITDWPRCSHPFAEDLKGQLFLISIRAQQPPINVRCLLHQEMLKFQLLFSDVTLKNVCYSSCGCFMIQGKLKSFSLPIIVCTNCSKNSTQYRRVYRKEIISDKKLFRSKSQKSDDGLRNCT